MKKITMLLFATTLFTACNKTDKSPYSYERGNIYSESDNTNFSSVLLELKPYIMDNNVKKYIVNAQIDSVLLQLDGENFGKENSLALDTSIVEKETVNNYFVTTDYISYPVNVYFKTEQPSLNTAGEYSSLLNNRVTVSPGFYNCRIASFQIKTASGTIKKVSTNISQFFEVKSGMKNYYLGSFEVLVK